MKTSALPAFAQCRRVVANRKGSRSIDVHVERLWIVSGGRIFAGLCRRPLKILTKVTTGVAPGGASQHNEQEEQNES